MLNFRLLGQGTRWKTVVILQVCMYIEVVPRQQGLPRPARLQDTWTAAATYAAQTAEVEFLTSAAQQDCSLFSYLACLLPSFSTVVSLDSERTRGVYNDLPLHVFLYCPFSFQSSCPYSVTFIWLTISVSEDFGLAF